MTATVASRVERVAGLAAGIVAAHGVIVLEPATAFLAKPFTIGQLTTRVREVLDAPRQPETRV